VDAEVVFVVLASAVTCLRHVVGEQSPGMLMDRPLTTYFCWVVEVVAHVRQVHGIPLQDVLHGTASGLMRIA